MATSRIQKWDSDNVYTSNAEIYTRMFDMGDPHAKKKINEFFITFTGTTSQAMVSLKVHYRFHNNDTWKLFGYGMTAGTGGRRLSLTPIYNSGTTFQMEQDSTDNSIVRIKDVYTIQLKLSFAANQKIEINDYAIEYRTVRSNSISEPEI